MRFAGLVLIGILAIGTIGSVNGQEKTIQPVHFSKLTPFLPDAPPGWTGEEPEGTNYTAADGSWSVATKKYLKSGTENLRTDVGILDSALNQVSWWKAWHEFYEWESTEGYAKRTKVKGFPVWEIYDQNSNKYNLFVNINDRFLVNIDTNSDKDAAYSFANSINYNGIAALGAAPSTTMSGGKVAVTQVEKIPVDAKEVQGFEVIFVITGFLAIIYLLRWRNKSF